MDNLKLEIEELIGAKIRDYEYYNAVKELSEEFGVPLNIVDELKEYWFSKDSSVLSDAGKDYLKKCKITFMMVANREQEE